jgi:hypothetical protein
MRLTHCFTSRHAVFSFSAGSGSVAASSVFASLPSVVGCGRTGGTTSGGTCDDVTTSLVLLSAILELGAATGDAKLFGVLSTGDVLLFVGGLSLFMDFLVFGSGGLFSPFLLSAFFVIS